MFDVVLLREGARKLNTVVQGVVRVVLVKNTFFAKKLPGKVYSISLCVP